MKINIIGDIAGRYDELIELLAKMPPADLTLAVGDLIDRGPKSAQVLEYFMTTPGTDALYGNHEDMLIAGVEHGQSRDWLWNGGGATLESFPDYTIPPGVLEWIKARPLYYKAPGLFVSHAPVTVIPRANVANVWSFIWSRVKPRKPASRYLVHGHNGLLELYETAGGRNYGICLDNSNAGELVGMHWPTRELYSVPLKQGK